MNHSRIIRRRIPQNLAQRFCKNQPFNNFIFPRDRIWIQTISALLDDPVLLFDFFKGQTFCNRLEPRQQPFRMFNFLRRFQGFQIRFLQYLFRNCGRSCVLPNKPNQIIVLLSGNCFNSFTYCSRRHAFPSFGMRDWINALALWMIRLRFRYKVLRSHGPKGQSGIF